MQFRQSGQSDERRRRVFRDEMLAAPHPEYRNLGCWQRNVRRQRLKTSCAALRTNRNALAQRLANEASPARDLAELFGRVA